MSRLTRDGTAEPNSRGQTLRRERGQGKSYFPCSADHEQDWQPYPVDVQSAESDDHTHRHTQTHTTSDCKSRPLVRCQVDRCTEGAITKRDIKTMSVAMLALLIEQQPTVSYTHGRNVLGRRAGKSALD